LERPAQDVKKPTALEFVPSHPEDHVWDAIVIGTGAGDATAGFNLARSRRSVLFVGARRFFPDAPDASLPETWLVSYEEMAAFYERAERLYRVRGTQDPLAPPGPNLL
jgi:choline dehydrogenase-like flavoprotein